MLSDDSGVAGDGEGDLEHAVVDEEDMIRGRNLQAASPQAVECLCSVLT